MTSILRVSESVILRFFESPILEIHVQELFENMNTDIYNRIYEIMNEPCLKSVKFDADSFYNSIFLRFKYHFFERLLNDAVEIALNNEREHDILINVLALVSEERLQNAIMGEGMIVAFIDVIRSVKTTHKVEDVMSEKIITILKQKYLGLEPS